MKTLELERWGLEPMTNSDMRTLEAGLIVGLFNLLVEAGKLVITEGADLAQGVQDGFNKIVN